MWFFRSVEYLTRPSFVWLAPTFALLGVFVVFDGRAPVLFGLSVQPLWLALFASFSLNVARRMPLVLARWRGEGDAWISVSIVGALFAALFVAGAFVQDVWILQAGWLVVIAVLALSYAIAAVFFDEAAVAGFLSRWATAGSFARTALWVMALQTSVVALIGGALMTRGDLFDWVVFASLGRLFLFYLFDWITILLYMTRPDEER